MSNARDTAASATNTVLLLIARLAFAAVLITRAWWRWMVAGMPAQVELLQQFAIPQAELVAWGTLILEAVGGALLALGLLTRLVALFVLAQHVITIVVIKWTAGPFLAEGGFEYNLALAALALVFVAVGASRAGLDSLLFRRRRRDHDADSSADLYQPKLGSTSV